jgi:hypothetical protein
MSRTSTDVVAPSPAASGSVHDHTAFELHENLQSRGVRLSDERALAPSNNDTLQPLSRTKSALLILVVASMIFIANLLAGILTVGLPRIARDIQLQENLLLW